MVKIALDPNMYYWFMPVPQTLHKARELGFDYVELSPTADFHFWHHYPKADDAYVAELNKAQKESGVKIATLNPVFNWACVDEEERQAQVRNWRRLLEIADQLDVREIVSEFSGDPNTPRRCEHQWYKSNEIGMGEVPWDELFSTLRDMNFDGVLSLCVFGWHDRADEINKKMIARVKSEFGQ